MPGAEQYITQVVILNLCKHADKLVQQLVGADGLVPGGGVTSPSNRVREGLDLPVYQELISRLHDVNKLC